MWSQRKLSVTHEAPDVWGTSTASLDWASTASGQDPFTHRHSRTAVLTELTLQWQEAENEFYSVLVRESHYRGNRKKEGRRRGPRVRVVCYSEKDEDL